MTEVITAPVADVAPIATPAVTPAPIENKPLSVREAANQQIAERDAAIKALKAKQAPPDEAAAPIQDGAGPQDPPADTTEGTDPVVEELPSIDPPRSWTKEEKEEFATYPREAQEKIARREQDREATLRRGQNEAAELKRSIEADRQKAEQARLQYENAYPQLIETVRQLQSGQFSDIKNHADAQALAITDPTRYVQYLAHQQGLAQMEADGKAIQERQVQEQRTKWSDFANREDKTLLDKAPELADEATMEKTSKGALKTLKDVGFDEQDLAKAWNGEIAISPRDHRFQLITLYATRYLEAKANATKPLPKPVPAVQRPGIATSQGDRSSANVEALRDKFKKASGLTQLRLAAELQRAERANRG